MPSILCEACGVRAESNAAKELGWQIRPPVCPDCLRWRLTDVAESAPRIRIEKRGRFWAVSEDGDLLCICVYRKGADAVATRVAALRGDVDGRG